MNIYFGKISGKFDTNQIDEGYYKSDKGSSWFGDLKIGDYAFIIGGDKIQFWKAREWGSKDNVECLWFDVLNNDIGIKLNKFTALNFFKITKNLVVLTSRSARNKAFFKLELTKYLDISYLSDSNTYKDNSLYRNIIIHQDQTYILNQSQDLQFYYDNEDLKFATNDFTKEGIINNFKNNLIYAGQGSVRKDNVIKLLLSKKDETSATFSNDEISMRSIYDTLFCEYKSKEKYYLVGAYWNNHKPQDQTNRFLENNIWQNGHDDKFIDIVNKVQVNDNIAIKSIDKKGNNMYIKALGKVVESNKDGKNLDVIWNEGFEGFKLNFSGGYWDTITEVKKKNHIDAIWNYSKTDSLNIETSRLKNKYMPNINQILYGPPGTGKTYNTILEASKIISNNENLNYKEAQDIFNDNLGDKIEFLTFHQNYSYEDFIQGLRPDVEQKELSFNRADGIFTKIATNALFEYYKLLQKNQVDSNNNSDLKIDLNDAYIEFLSSLQKDQEFETKTGAKIKVDNFTDRQNIEFKPLNGIKSYLVSGSRLLKLYSVFKNIDDIKNVNEDIRNVIGGCNSTMYYVALREFINFLKVYENTLTEFVDKEDDYDYDNITYSRKKELLSNIELSELRKISNDEVLKYVIIIDEINRANISRVFGELITLIEKDKRSHGSLPIKAKLPSGEQFIVPSNLYIIGTMNTADKSIALLDIALRRRFEFVPKYPELIILKDGDNLIEENNILEKLNNAIIDRKGHDFTIGHSYFMGSEFTLKNTINNKVIPLLLEYFMNDVDEVKNILNAAGLDVNGWPMKLVGND
jgi:hypothetical protein